MRGYRTGNKTLPPLPPKKEPQLTPISANTVLVDLETAVQLLAEQKGLKLSVKTIREYCRSRKWIEGYHWVKPSRNYLIHMTAVYETIAQVR